MSSNNRNRRSRRGKNFSKQSGKNAAIGEMKSTNADTGLTIRNIPLFAYRTRRTLQYYTAGFVTPGASAASAYVLSANGIFDPDITGTGGQPMGFDQMMTFYNHYTVMRSRIRVVATHVTTSITPCCAIVVSGSSTVNTVIENMVENGDLSWVTLTYAGAFGASSKLTRSVDCGKFQGIDDVLDDPNMRGDSASNPTEQLYYHVAVWNPYSAAVPTVDFQAVIEYDVMFHEPRKGTLSSTRKTALTPAAPTDCATTSGMEWVLMERKR